MQNTHTHKSQKSKLVFKLKTACRQLTVIPSIGSDMLIMSFAVSEFVTVTVIDCKKETRKIAINFLKI